VRTPLVRAPWWVTGLFAGVVYGGGMGLFRWLTDGASGTEAVVYGLGTGVPFGLVMGLLITWQNRGMREAAGEVHVDALRQLGWFGMRRRIPVEPELREAASRLTRYQLDQVRRQRRWAVPFFGVVLAIFVVLALVGTTNGWLMAGFVFVLVIGYVQVPRILERRLDRLRDPEDEVA
jgi:Flp pilus assembly protein TadB